MRNLNFLRKSERKSVGTTLALTVGSPSAHRRYSALKHLAFMLLFLLGSLNVWGASATCTLSSAQIKAGSGSTSYGGASATDGCDNTWNAYAIKNQHSNATSDYHFWQIKKYASNTAYYIQVPTMPGNISSLTVTVSNSSKARNGGGNTATLYFSNSNSTSSAGTGVASGTGTSSVTIDCSSLNLTSGYITASGAVRIWDVEVTYETTGGSGSSKPTVSVEPDGGDFVGSVEVTITPSDGATAYYTTDAEKKDAPSISTWTAYNGSNKPSFTENTTLYVAAVKDATWSDVATKTFTKVEPLVTIPDLADAMTNSDQSVYVTFGGWQVSVVKNSQAFVTDGTNGLIIYQSGHGLVEGDILTGTVQCTLVSYNGVVELKGVTKTMDGITVSDGTISPVVKTIAEANDLTTLNTGLLIKLENVTYNGTAFVDAGSNTIAPYNTFYSYSLTSGQKYNVTGIVQQYQSNSQIYPRKAGDIEALTTIATPTFSPAAGEYTEVQNVTLSCTTDDATIYYTTDGTNPTNESTAYSSAIEVGASTTIKAIAYKGEDHSEIATAVYTINIPIPSHDFQVVHKFETGEGFEFPADWDGDYEEHEISYTDDKVVFASANKQSSGQAIDDCPVTKGHAISLVLTNSSKLISAVRFDYKQWGAKAQTLTMKYSTDGGATYNAFNPAVSSTNFALQVLDLPDGTNAIQVTGSNSSNQVGLTSIAFDLANKPVVTKTVTITPPSNGTLVVKNAGVAIENGAAIEVGTTLTIEATPNTGYSLSSISVKDESDNDVPVNGDNEFDVPNSNVTVSATFVEDVRPEASLTLWENGSEVAYPGSHKQNDHVTLPSSVTHNCYGREFVGWSTIEIAQTDTKPAYLEPGADFTLSAEGVNTLYAVYAAVATPAGYQKLESDAFETTATYVIGALNGSDEECYFYYYESVDANIWGKMSNDPVTNAPLLFTLSGTADELVAQDAAGNYLKPVSGKFQMSASSQNFVLADDGTITTASLNLRYNSSGDYGLRWYSNTTGTSAYFYKVVAPTYNKYSTTCDEAIDAPIFDPVEGTYTSAQNITIAAATGATIYYTMTNDGSEPADPTQSSDVYSSAISLNAAGTYKFKAFAVKGEAESDITSATYTINLPLTTIPDVFAKASAVGSTETEVTVVFNDWVVSGIGGTDNKNVYVTDGTNGFIIFGASHGFAVNDKISGTVTCQLKLFSQAAEVVGLTKSDITTAGGSVTNDGVITPIAKTIASLGGVNTGAPIIVENVMFDGADLVDASDNKIQPYTTLYAGAVTSLTENKYYNVTGIYTQFNTKKEILPRDADDIDELTQEAPTMTWYTSDAKAATIAANATYTINLGDAFAPVFETNSAGALTYTSSDQTIAEINETTGTLTLKGVTGTTFIKCAVAAAGDYTAGEQGFTLRVREAVAGENVAIVAQYDGKWYAMKNTFTGAKTAEAIEVTYADGKIWDLPTADQEAITWVRTVDEGNVTFQVSNGDYLKTSGNDLALDAGESGNYQWNWNSTYYRTGEQTRTFMYRESVTGFRSYAVSNAETSDYSALPVVTAAVFATTPEVIRGDLSAGKWGTLCPKQTVEYVEGATFYQISYLEEQGGLPYNVVFDQISGTTLTAGQPYFFIAEGEEIRGIKTGAELTEAGDGVNGFYGYIGASSKELTVYNTDYNAAANNTFVIHNNSVFRINQGGTMLKSERCYININSTEPSRTAKSSIPGRRRISMSVQNTNVATGVDAINASETPMKLMIDGQLFILRGEKMYDATGRLVK